MPDHLGPPREIESQLATLAFTDVILAMGLAGIPMAFEPEDFRLGLRDSMYEAWPKPKTTVVQHD